MTESAPIPSADNQPLNDDIPCHACGYNLRTRRPDQDCPECGADVLTSIQQAERRRSRPVLTLEGFGVMTRLIYVLFGVLIPVIPLFIAEVAREPLFVEWQSGEWSDYIGMLLGGVPARPFYPFMIFACAAMIALVKKPAQNGYKTWVQCGLITGIVVGAQYTLILFGQGEFVGLFMGLIAVAFGLSFSLLCLKYPQRWIDWHIDSGFTQKRVWLGLIGVYVFISILSAVLGADGAFFIPLLLAIMLSSWFCMAVYGLALARVLRSRRLMGDTKTDEGHTPWWLWLFGGFIGYVVAWAGSIVLAMNEYAKLPTQPPDCYICTAAARGHTHLVGSEPVTLSSGQTIRVNQQMRVLKATEIAMRVISPRTHRACRAIYNRLGPFLAKRMTHPVLADAAYLTLSPISWLCRTILQRIVPDFHTKIDRFYRN